MTEHTPGPWVVNETRGHAFFIDAPDHNICYVGRIAEADARLIAAAPDLLEACEKALEAAANLPSCDSQLDRQTLDDLYDQLAHVINKATGSKL